MITIYCTLIINKRRTFEQVPDNLKEEVKARLTKLGYDTNGDPIVVED